MPPRVYVCVGRLPPQPGRQLSGTPAVGLYMWTPQLPLSLLTPPPSALGTPTGRFRSSACLLLCPSFPALTWLPSPLHIWGVLFLTPKFSHPFLSSSLSSCSVGSHQGCRVATVRGMWFLFIFSELSGALSLCVSCYPPGLFRMSCLPFTISPTRELSLIH